MFIFKENLYLPSQGLPSLFRNSDIKLNIVTVQEFQLKKEMFVISQLLIRFGKKQINIGLKIIISDIVHEYNIEFFDDQGHIRMRPKGLS